MSPAPEPSISGNPSPEEEAAIIAALEQLLKQEESARKPSAWKLHGRMMSLGASPADLRAWSQRPWRLAGKGSWRSAGVNNKGRGDAK